jgi:hypothetical protein
MDAQSRAAALVEYSSGPSSHSILDFVARRLVSSWDELSREIRDRRTNLLLSAVLALHVYCAGWHGGQLRWSVFFTPVTLASVLVLLPDGFTPQDGLSGIKTPQNLLLATRCVAFTCVVHGMRRVGQLRSSNSSGPSLTLAFLIFCCRRLRFPPQDGLSRDQTKRNCCFPRAVLRCTCIVHRVR